MNTCNLIRLRKSISEVFFTFNKSFDHNASSALENIKNNIEHETVIGMCSRKYFHWIKIIQFRLD